MSRSKAPPRIKGPYSERGGTRFRIRICDAAGRRDLYFPTRKAALTAIKEAARELPPSAKGRSLRKILDAYVKEKEQPTHIKPPFARMSSSRTGGTRCTGSVRLGFETSK